MDYTLLIKIGIGIGGLIILTQFLIQEGRVEANIPWQIRAYVRILTMVIFIYLLNMGIILFVPDTDAAKIKVFTDGINLSSDLVKTLLGAIIGAVSMSIAKDKNLDGKPDSEEDVTPSESPKP